MIQQVLFMLTAGGELRSKATGRTVEDPRNVSLVNDSHANIGQYRGWHERSFSSESWGAPCGCSETILVDARVRCIGCGRHHERLTDLVTSGRWKRSQFVPGKYPIDEPWKR